jgi:hypothetical protein
MCGRRTCRRQYGQPNAHEGSLQDALEINASMTQPKALVRYIEDTPSRASDTCRSGTPNTHTDRHRGVHRRSAQIGLGASLLAPLSLTSGASRAHSGETVRIGLGEHRVGRGRAHSRRVDRASGMESSSAKSRAPRRTSSTMRRSWARANLAPVSVSHPQTQGFFDMRLRRWRCGQTRRETTQNARGRTTASTRPGARQTVGPRRAIHFAMRRRPPADCDARITDQALGARLALVHARHPEWLSQDSSAAEEA